MLGITYTYIINRQILLITLGSVLLFLLSHNAVQGQSNQTVVNGVNTPVINFPVTGCTYNWVNSNPAIGLAASGTGDIASFIPINTGNAPIITTITATPVATEYAYISNVHSNNVSVINLTTNTVIATIPVGSEPAGVSVSPDGTRVYVGNTLSNTVSVINTITNTVVATIPVGNYPYSLLVSKDGSKVYVVNTSSNFMSIINTATNTVSGTIPLNNYFATCVASNSDGSKLYVSNWSARVVYVINTANNTVVSTISFPITAYPWSLAVTPDDSKVYVGNENNNQTFYVINTTNNNLSVINSSSSISPDGLVISPDGTRLYIANSQSNNISVINTATNTLVTTIPVNILPLGVSLNKSGGLLYVTNNGSNNVSVINTATNTVINTIAVGNIPLALGNFIASGPGCGAPVTFTITVNPPQPTISATAVSPLSTVYGTPSFSNSFNVSGAYMSGAITITAPPGFEISKDDVTFSNIITIGSSGTIASTPVHIRLASATYAGNHNGNIVLSSTGATDVNQSVTGTVSPAPLTITATDVQKKYGEVLTDINASTAFTFFGLKNGETIGNVNIHYDAGEAANAIVNLYSGGIIPSLAAGGTFKAANYDITYIPGNITVLPAPLTIKADDKFKVYGAVNPVLTFTYNGFVNNENETQLITWPNVSTIAGTVSPIGQYPIIVSGGSAANYAITYIAGTLTIAAAPKEISVPNAFTPNGDGINDTWVIKNLQDYQNSMIMVYNRYGQEVFKSRGYSIPWDGTKNGSYVPGGTYYYKITLDNNSQILAGYISVIR
ncbi:MAG: MBG domain-containing protein [Mucilaginibacter sp.]